MRAAAIPSIVTPWIVYSSIILYFLTTDTMKSNRNKEQDSKKRTKRAAVSTRGGRIVPCSRATPKSGSCVKPRLCSGLTVAGADTCCGGVAPVAGKACFMGIGLLSVVHIPAVVSISVWVGFLGGGSSYPPLWSAAVASDRGFPG